MATKIALPTTESAEDQALLELLRLLGTRGYRFVTPTPATHARVVARPSRRHARSIDDVLGWSIPFADDTLDREALRLLRAADAIEPTGGLWRSRIRISSLGDLLFVHSAYPTEERDAVFFGPDSYRFADFIRAELDLRPPPPAARMADIGTGAGVAAALLACDYPGAEVIATDPNFNALRFARLNIEAAGVSARLVQTSGLDHIDGPLDLVTINPPYIADDGGRAYRHGGAMHGGALSLELAQQAVSVLAPGGRLLLYTGSAIVLGRDALRDALAATARANDCILHYRELDPDVFGEELDTPRYAEVDRIAAVGAVMTRGAN
jgi:methylase of polypeptide subunit release factors